MRALDLAPLLRSTIGFDQINRLFENAIGSNEPAYPPYNIEKLSDDNYRITVALAGFTENDLDITLHDGTLSITGKGASEEDEEEQNEYLYRGIAKRAFERHFRLADTIKVLDARFENGLLIIELQRIVPDHLKARKIKINGQIDGNITP